VRGPDNVTRGTNVREHSWGAVRRNGSGGFTVTLPSGSQQTTFVLRRVTAGQAATANVTVVDACGDWPTVAGGGPTTF
jgi:hypothetical protein